MAKVKNAALAEGDTPEPVARVIGEEQVVEAADLLVANTDLEAEELINLYDADPTRSRSSTPVSTSTSSADGPGARPVAQLDLPADAAVVMFAGRIQPLKAPDVLLRAVAVLLDQDPSLRSRLVVPVVGGPSGSGLEHPSRSPSSPTSSASTAWCGSCRRWPGRARGVVRRLHRGRRAVVQRVLRPGRCRGPGDRHPGGGRRGRRADDRRRRRAQRAAGRRPRAARLGRGLRRLIDDPALAARLGEGRWRRPGSSPGSARPPARSRPTSGPAR